MIGLFGMAAAAGFGAEGPLALTAAAGGGLVASDAGEAVLGGGAFAFAWRSSTTAVGALSMKVALRSSLAGFGPWALGGT